MDDAPIVEMKKLMLSSSLDADDASASQCARHARRHSPTQRWMQKAESRDHATLRAAAQLLDGSLDFG